MNLGIVARAELGRGLGIQSWEACRHLDPARVLIVDVGDEHEAHPITPAAFPRATVVDVTDGWELPEAKCRAWLRGLDVVLSFETFYDWRFCDWAREMGCRTVVQVNPEFYRHGQYRLPHPDGWWNPTTWRMGHLPEGTRHVPVPVALDRFAPRDMSRAGAPRFLHSVGKAAMYDRNGTETYLRACYLAQTLDATLITQDPPDVAPAASWVQTRAGGVGDYWRAYDGYDVLVLPRRYGGLCLPAQEAMAAGLAVVMPATSPNVECWPVVPVHARTAGRVPLPAGWVEMTEVDAGTLADTMIRLANDPAELTTARDASRGWAEAHSWPNMVDRYLAELAHVIAHPAGPPARKADQGHNPFAAQS